MSNIKNLAKQTMWYGVSSIAARFVNYLLTPYLTYAFSKAEYGEMSVIYAFIPFMNVVFTYGMETAFFRFANKEEDKKVYSTITISIFTSTLLLTGLLLLLHQPLVSLLKIKEHNNYLFLAITIIALDALTAIAFVRLRQDGKPIKFAIVRVGSILVNIAAVFFFLSICPKWLAQNPSHWCSSFYNKNWAVGYVLVANIIQSGLSVLLLSKELLAFTWKFDYALWKKMMLYALPLVLAGFAGMINETFDRIMLNWWAPVDNEIAAQAEVGIYSACYKLSILITLAVQAFRMGAEPFFFKQAKEANAPKIYARVMKFFVITLCVMFLAVMLFIDVWKYFISNKEMWVGLKVVPILLMANMFLGIYYNLSIWYKLGNKTIAGAYITLIGAAITLLINAIFIPHFSYMACAWATFFCYGSMMVISYVWGQKNYPIPYRTKKLLAYLLITLAIYGLHNLFILLYSPVWFALTIGTLLLLIFIRFIVWAEAKELKSLPIVGKYIR